MLTNNVSERVHRRLVQTFSMLLACSLVPAGATPTTTDKVVATVAGEPISLADLHHTMSSANTESDRAAENDVVELLVVRKQLALAAQAETTMQTDNVERALDGLMRTLAPADIINAIIERALVEHYHRSHYMIRASHILIGVEQDADSAAIDRARQRALSLRESIVAGNTPFASAARRYSDDPNRGQDAGDLGYFGVFEQLYPVETAAFETPIGAISAPIKTRFGFYLVQVRERVRLPGSKHMAHVMIKANGQHTKRRIDKIHELAGVKDFAELAREYSEDSRTSVRGGDLGTDRLVDALEGARLSLAVGEYSEPIRSATGWHVVKVTGTTPFPTFEQARSKLQEKMRIEGRASVLHRALVRRDRSYPVVRDMLSYYKDHLLASAYLSKRLSVPAVNDDRALFKAISEYRSAIEALQLDTRYVVHIER